MAGIPKIPRYVRVYDYLEAGDVVKSKSHDILVKESFCRRTNKFKTSFQMSQWETIHFLEMELWCYHCFKILG